MMVKEIWPGTFALYKPVERSARNKAKWREERIGGNARIAPFSCLTMWRMDALTAMR